MCRFQAQADIFHFKCTFVRDLITLIDLPVKCTPHYLYLPNSLLPLPCLGYFRVVKGTELGSVVITRRRRENFKECGTDN